MDCFPTPIVLKKGGDFLKALSNPRSVQRTVCPREKFLGCVDESGHLSLQLISEENQRIVVKNNDFVQCQWVVPLRAQQDSVMDQRRDGTSELLAVTSDLDCKWYIVSETLGLGVPAGAEWKARERKEDEWKWSGGGGVKVKLMAVLKKTDLCYKLRKMDFPDVLESVVFLGSEGGQAMLLFNSCLVCHFSLDVEFGTLALAGCYLLQLSLQHYQDDQLPDTPGRLACCAFNSPLLFAMTEDGIVFIHHASSGSSIGIVNVLDYSYYHCGRSCELLSDITKSCCFQLLCVSHDVNSIAVPTPANHLLLVNIPDYFHKFPHHYHPEFMFRATKLNDRSISLPFGAVRPDISSEEEEERRIYGGLLPLQHALKYQGNFPGSYAWECRMDNLNETVRDFNFEKSSFISVKRSSQLSRSCVGHGNSGGGAIDIVVLPPKRSWYEVPQLPNSFQDVLTDGTPVITGMQRTSSLKQVHNQEASTSPLSYYQTGCILPASCPADLAVVHIAFRTDLVVVYYGWLGGRLAEDAEANVSSKLKLPVVGITLYHTGSQSYTYSSLPQPSFLLRASLPDQLVYFVNELSFFIVTFNLSQEEFVGKMLMFGSASVAEELCHLNHWDNCFLPINALVTALELRQLDTLAFFLRSRDNEHNQDSDLPTLPPLPPEQIGTVVQLLIDAVQRNFQEEHHCQFAGQLLIMTLGFVTRTIKSEVMRDGSSDAKRKISEGKGKPSDGAEQAHVSVMELTSYIQKLRDFLPVATVAMRDHLGGKLTQEEEACLEEDTAEDYVTELMDRALLADWDKLSPKEVIKVALQQSCLPLAQAYLLQRKPEHFYKPRMASGSYVLEPASQRAVSLTEASYRHGQNHYSTSSHVHLFDASLHSMQVTGVGYVMEALEQRDIELVKCLLTNLGLDVQLNLKHVCFHTLDHALRDYLCSFVLTTDNESEALDWLHKLEKYYPLESYDQALELCSKPTSRKMAFHSTILPKLHSVSRTATVPSLGNLQDLYPETFGGDHSLSWDPKVSTPSSHSSALYLQAPLAVVLNWNTPTKQRLLFDCFVLRGPTKGSNFEQLMEEQYVFDYYVSHNDGKGALQFLMSKVSALEDPTPCPAYVNSLFSAMPQATEHVRNTLLDELARDGVYLLSELEDFHLLLRRLGRVHSLFSLPHPFVKVADNLCQFKKDDDSHMDFDLVSMEAFHRKFLNFLVENRFFSLMNHYLDLYGLGLSDASIATLGLNKIYQPWVSVLLNYRRAALNPLDSDMIFKASLSCGNLLLSDHTPHGFTVTGMLQAGRTLMVLSTVMFAQVPLEEAINVSNCGQPWYAEAGALKQAIAAYPSLQAAIFPPAPTSLTPAQSQDITLYELLQDNVSFDVTRLFKWQATNTVVSGQDDTVIHVSEMPHFSSTLLAQKFAVCEHLDYTYYLKRGQPSFAFANFVAAKLVGHSNTAKRIDRLEARVYRLALHDFNNGRLAASCAAFLEMVGRDSTCLRVDLQIAARIAKFNCVERVKDVDIKCYDCKSDYDVLVSQFYQLFKSCDDLVATALLVQLEAATHAMINGSGVEICGIEAEECWQLVQSFCVCHQLPPSVAFITACANQGQWLPLLCDSQLNSITPRKVLMIVDKSLNNSCVKDHLSLSLSFMDTSKQPLSPLMKGGEGADALKCRRRRPSSALRSCLGKTNHFGIAQTNLRAKFYSRVGLQRVASTRALSSEEGGVADGEEERGLQNGQVVGGDADSTTLPSKQFPAPLLEDELPRDLFSAMFKSETYESTWRALLAHAIALHRPLLAIMAACYEESSVMECACVWLFSTLCPSAYEKLTLHLGVNGEKSADELAHCAEIQWREWSTLDLSLMLISAMQHSPSPAAHFSLVFRYFDENSPLLSFLKFHEDFVLRGDYNACRKHLQEFRLILDKCKIYSFGGMIADLCWVEQVASSMASHMLVTCPTSFERSHLLRLLSEEHFGEEFKCSVLNFGDLHLMSGVLNEAGLSSTIAFTVKEHFSTTPGVKSLNEICSVRVRVNTDYVLGLLLEKGQFDIARKYASIVESTTSQVTIKEAEYNLMQLRASSFWKYTNARLNFWHQCDSKFHVANVEAKDAAEFFQLVIDDAEAMSFENGGQGRPCMTAMERALLLALLLKWSKEKVGFRVEQARELEKKIWLSHIQSAIEQEEEEELLPQSDFGYSLLSFIPQADNSTLSLFSHPGHTSLFSFLSISAQPEFKGRRQLTEFILEDHVSVALEGGCRSTLNNKEREVFDMMLGRLMNAGMLSQASGLAALFEHDSADLTIVCCCIQLCQGKLTPSQLTEGVLSLVSSRQPRQLNDPCTPTLDDPNHSWKASELIRMMTTLSDRALYARQCCDCIITCFRIALALDVPYVSVVNTDPFETLTGLLSCRNTDRFAIASKFIATCNLSSKEVAGYLSACVATSLKEQYREGEANPTDSLKSQVFLPNMSSSQFQEIAQLTSEPALVGNSLLNMARSLTSVQEETNANVHIRVELLIRSHDCYTIGCSVDGIGTVLVVAQSWIQDLVKQKHFKLMVRLLTGISRYHEMSYIIGLLIEHDEFEYLVRTGVEKEEQLRVALIEYLQKHGNDNERLQMVALNFNMFRELAMTTEERAKVELASIKSNHLATNNTETVKKLKSIFDDFRAAAKTYSHENCLNNAERCLSQARLVALQLSVLNYNKQVINLEAKEVLKFMEDQPFTEALIVSDAYKQCIWADWINPLYKHVIIGGDFHYLAEYRTAFTMTTTVYTELASKYQRNRVRTQETNKNMRRLLVDLKNLILKQKLASELGFDDLFPSSKYDAGYMRDIQRL